VRAPGVAAAEAPKAHPAAPEGAPLFDSFQGVLGTSRDVAAAARQERGEQRLVEAGQKEEGPAQGFLPGVGHGMKCLTLGRAYKSKVQGILGGVRM